MSISLDVYKIKEPEKYKQIEKFSFDNFSYEYECLVFSLSYFENILIVQELFKLTNEKNLGDGNNELYLIEKDDFIEIQKNFFHEIRHTLNLENYMLERLDEFFRSVERYITLETYLFFNIG